VTDEPVGLEIEERDEVVVAHITGELDLASAPGTGKDIEAAVPTSVRGLVVDLSKLEFIDSSGVAMLFSLVRRLDSRRQHVRVVSPEGRPVARVLQIVEFQRAAPVQPDLEAAIADID
jgi:anti-anti-sigma factor